MALSATCCSAVTRLTTRSNGRKARENVPRCAEELRRAAVLRCVGPFHWRFLLRDFLPASGRDSASTRARSSSASRCSPAGNVRFIHAHAPRSPARWKARLTARAPISSARVRKLRTECARTSVDSCNSQAVPVLLAIQRAAAILATCCLAPRRSSASMGRAPRERFSCSGRMAASMANACLCSLNSAWAMSTTR